MFHWPDKAKIASLNSLFTFKKNQESGNTMDFVEDLGEIKLFDTFPQYDEAGKEKSFEKEEKPKPRYRRRRITEHM